jgi:hypothetical protein
MPFRQALAQANAQRAREGAPQAVVIKGGDPNGAFDTTGTEFGILNLANTHQVTVYEVRDPAAIPGIMDRHNPQVIFWQVHGTPGRFHFTGVHDERKPDEGVLTSAHAGDLRIPYRAQQFLDVCDGATPPKTGGPSMAEALSRRYGGRAVGTSEKVLSDTQFFHLSHGEIHAHAFPAIPGVAMDEVAQQIPPWQRERILVYESGQVVSSP